MPALHFSYVSKLFLYLMCLLVIEGMFAQNDIDLKADVPFDDSFKVGSLPNGLTYYIKSNPYPKGKASFYLYQNVGAVLETEEQNGLAHFIEHMAFNGTKHFPGNSLVDMLEKKGIKFGKEINAYTLPNETVYNLSHVPLKNEKDIDSLLLVLYDWCDSMSLESEEIDAERKVIQEEWRQRYNANYRLNQQLKFVKYNNSIYSRRDAMGDMEIIKNFEHESLRSFYRDWYRTDLQAIGIVGDFDPELMEQKVKNLFSKIIPVENPAKREYVIIPDNESPLYKIATDKEINNFKLSMEIRHYHKKDNSQSQLREDFVNTFFNSLINARFKKLLLKEKSPYTSARAIYTDFVKNYKVFNLSLTAKEDNLDKAFESVYAELQRVVQHGFTQKEVDDLKSKMLANNEKWLERSKKANSESYAKRIKDAYLDQVSIPSHEFSYNFAKSIIPGITAKEVSQLAENYLTEKNRVFTITAPERENLELPSLKDILKIIEEVESTELNPYKDETTTPLNISLLENVPSEGGNIVQEKLLRDFRAVEWQLANGAKVIYKYKKNNKNLLLKAVSDGGASLYDIKDIPSMQAVSLVNKFGIGELDPVTYKKLMHNSSAQSSISLKTYSEEISASASIQDIESMFQLVYMRFEAPRFDEEVYNSIMSRNYKSLQTSNQNPNKIIGEAYKKLAANGDPRQFDYNKEYLDQISFDRLQEIYHERFSGAGDFNFYLIGDIPFKTVKSMVDQYLGAIKPGNANERWEPLEDYFPAGFNKHHVEVPLEAPRSTVVIKMQEEKAYSRKSIVYHSILGDILNIRLIENIREKEGGVYTIGVNAGNSRKPHSQLNMDISFNCDPGNAEKLNSLIFNEIENIQNEVSQSDLDKVVQHLKQSRAKNIKSNSFWMSVLENYHTYGENMLSPEYFNKILGNASTRDIEEAAKQFFNNAHTLNIIFSPEAD